MSDARATSILLVDDDDVFRERLARALRVRGLSVVEAGDHEHAIAAISESGPTYALVDLRLPSGSGLDIVRAIAARRPSTVTIVLTGYGSIATALEAVKLGAAHYLTKPAGADDILASFARVTDGAEPPLEIEGESDEVPSLDRVEWEHINRVLADSGGNVSEAARRLGIHRRSLQRKLGKRPVKR
jgi:two-component system response regulator RegA